MPGLDRHTFVPWPECNRPQGLVTSPLECYAPTLPRLQAVHLSIRMASVRRSFSSQVSLSSAMIFSVSWGVKQSTVRSQGVCARGWGMSKEPGSQERDFRVLGFKLQAPPIPVCEILVTYRRHGSSREHVPEQRSQNKSRGEERTDTPARHWKAAANLNSSSQGMQALLINGTVPGLLPTYVLEGPHTSGGPPNLQ